MFSFLFKNWFDHSMCEPHPAKTKGFATPNLRFNLVSVVNLFQAVILLLKMLWNSRVSVCLFSKSIYYNLPWLTT